MVSDPDAREIARQFGPDRAEAGPPEEKREGQILGVGLDVAYAVHLSELVQLGDLSDEDTGLLRWDYEAELSRKKNDLLRVPYVAVDLEAFLSRAVAPSYCRFALDMFATAAIQALARRWSPGREIALDVEDIRDSLRIQVKHLRGCPLSISGYISRESSDWGSDQGWLYCEPRSKAHAEKEPVTFSLVAEHGGWEREGINE